MSYLKHLLKKYFQSFWLRSRISPSVQISQRHLLHFYQLHHQHKEIINLKTSGFRVFSQFEEDGKILFILAVIGIKNSSFIEIGSDDGINSNCANLALNFGWHGLFIDANPRSISRGRYFYNHHPNKFGYKPIFVHSKITRKNINDIIRQNGYAGEVDLLSLDIDGNDYWIWDAITEVNPRIVIIETHNIYGKRNIVVPYDPEYSFPGKHPQYHGASPVAMVKLGNKKGYRLIGANELGFNFIFLRNDLGQDVLREVTIDEVLAHPSCSLDEKGLDPAVLTLPFITPIE
ncbi:MAG TPA: hypothetical protein VMZ69_03355 [Saprospiraceae bacterium]|nr:hypothetical protein [Saprospiraceae bacterium]